MKDVVCGDRPWRPALNPTRYIVEATKIGLKSLSRACVRYSLHVQRAQTHGTILLFFILAGTPHVSPKPS